MSVSQTDRHTWDLWTQSGSGLGPCSTQWLQGDSIYLFSISVVVNQSAIQLAQRHRAAQRAKVWS